MKENQWIKSYIILWTGQFLSLLTSSAVNFAVIIWLSLEMKSAEVLAYAGIAGLLPQGLIGPFVGVFIDRWDRKKVMIFADAFIAVCTFLMTFILSNEEASLIWIYILLACRSIGSAFHTPSFQAIAPLMVPENQLLRVSGVNQMVQSISNIAGPALGALAIAQFPIAQVLYLDIIGAIAGISTFLIVNIPKLPQKESDSSIKGVIEDLKEGFHAIYENKGLSYLFLYSMIATLFIMPIAILFPLLTIEHYRGDKFEMSLIEIVWGIGMLIGGFILGILKLKINKIYLINCMHLVIGFTFAISGIFSSEYFWAFALATTIAGMAMSIFSASFFTTIQEEIDPSVLGRVFSMYFSFALLPSLIGLLFAGYLADNLGILRIFIFGGLSVLIVGILSFLTPALMKMSKKEKTLLSNTNLSMPE